MLAAEWLLGPYWLRSFVAALLRTTVRIGLAFFCGVCEAWVREPMHGVFFFASDRDLAA